MRNRLAQPEVKCVLATNVRNERSIEGRVCGDGEHERHEQLQRSACHDGCSASAALQQRIPNVGKYSWRLLREEYRQMTAVVCDDMHDVDFTFNSLQHSASYDATS